MRDFREWDRDSRVRLSLPLVPPRLRCRPRGLGPGEQRPASDVLGFMRSHYRRSKLAALVMSLGRIAMPIVLADDSIVRAPVLEFTTRKAEPLHRAPKLVCSHTGVALGGVEVLMAEQFLNLAQVGPGAEEFGGENVPERVRRHPLALGDPGGSRVAEEGLRHDCLREPAALHADEERRLGISYTDAEIVEEERLECRVDRHDPLTTALRLAHP